MKTTRQTRRTKKTEKVNGLLSASDSANENNCLGDVGSGNGVNEGSEYIKRGSNCVDEVLAKDPIVHHKKFGKIRVSGQNDNSLDTESLGTDSLKDYAQLDTKSPDENDVEPSESNRFSNDANILDIMRGIEISAPKTRNTYSDFRKQSSVYKVENDIPLDGSVIIKPGTFSSNTITSSVKPNLFYDASTPSELNSVNFLKVLQGIEMLERNVSVPLEYDGNLPKQDKDFLISSTPPPAPMYINVESDGQCKDLYSESRLELNIKTENEEESEVTIKCVDDLKVEDSSKVTDTSSPDEASSDIQNETEETTSKLHNIALNDCGSIVSKACEEVLDKKASGIRSRTASTDTVVSESSSNCGAAIRRSNRIRSIGIMKQREREQAAVKCESVARSPVSSGSPATTPLAPGYDDKPVKVKSRWRRSSEMETHNGKPVDSESILTACSSPVNTSQVQVVNLEPTPEDLERLEKEKREIEEGLSTFTILTENEYKMER